MRNRLNTINRALKRLNHQDRCDNWRLATEKAADNPRKMWNLCKTLRGKSAGVPSLRLEDGTVVVDDYTKAETFAKHFADAHTTYVRPDQSLDNFDDEIAANASTIRNLSLAAHGESPHRPITMNELRGHIRSLRPNKAPGEDTITNKMIKMLDIEALQKILHLFNVCFSTSFWPIAWKSARVIPIAKPGKAKTYPKNYRPISLLNAVGKLFERVVKEKLTIATEHFLNPEQFGFRAGRSAIQQAMRVVNAAKKKKKRKPGETQQELSRSTLQKPLTLSGMTAS